MLDSSSEIGSMGFGCELIVGDVEWMRWVSAKSMRREEGNVDRFLPPFVFFIIVNAFSYCLKLK